MADAKEKGFFTESTQYNKGTLERQLIHEIVSSGENLHVIREAFLNKRARDVFDEEKAPIVMNEKTPCIIVGSGASLNLGIEALRNWKGGIFCTTSHAVSLVRFGIEPTHIVDLDPFCNWNEIKEVDWSKTKTKLVLHPGCWPDLVRNWPNEMLLYMENMGNKNSFYNTTQKQMYTIREDQGKGIRDPVFRYMVRTSFALFACSPPLQLFVADKLGYGNAFLVGCDFSYTYGQERFSDYSLKPDLPKEFYEKYPNGVYTSGFYNDPDWESYWQKNEHPLKEIPPERVPVTTNNGIPSERIHIYYKKNMMSAWRLSGKTMYTTDKGAMYEVPFANLKTVIKRQGLGYATQHPWFIQEITDKYLSSIGCYVVEAEGGKSFIESLKPMEEVKNYINELNRQYFCPACKNLMLSQGDENLSGKECPVCKRPGIAKVNQVNLQENMSRIEQLWLSNQAKEETIENAESK